MGKLHRSRGARPSLPAGVSIVASLLAVGLAVGCGGSGAGGGGQSNTGSNSTSQGGNGGAGGASSSSSSSGTTGGAGGMAPKPCVADTDCAGNPKGAFCDTTSGECVACLPATDSCPEGKYCNPTSFTCANGCKADADCAGDPNGATHCNPATHGCVNCLTESDCPAGQVCYDAGNVCIPGCSPTHDCQTGFTCCGTTCRDLQNDFTNCGECGKPCTNPVNATSQCTTGMCQLKACLPAFSDCNGNMVDGCEWNKLQDGPCTCVPGATQPCYQGSPGTENVGPCMAGIQTCDSTGTGWGACIGQVLPVFEVCNNGIDEDCDGTADNVPDQDGDGWTLCNGDCNDNNKLINPGALEVFGDSVDNDCDPTTGDNLIPVACSASQKFSTVTGLDVARAMDICQNTTAGATGPAKKWGLISAEQRLANGTLPTGTALTDLQNKQTAISTLFGNTVTPKRFNTMAVISSGMARDSNDAGWVTPISGTSLTTSIAFPGTGPLATYVNAHGGGLLPGQCAGSTCPVGTGANDSVNIRLQIRTPTNAQGFSYDFRFYSAEYQSFQCTQFNDYYLASLTSAAPGIPADRNISFDSLGNAVSVNNGFFQDCGGNSKNCGPCPFGTASLVGTGFDSVNGGSTEWLTTDSPIVPGETITLDLMVFDVGDHIYDTLVLLDNFRWSLTPVTLGTHT